MNFSIVETPLSCFRGRGKLRNPDAERTRLRIDKQNEKKLSLMRKSYDFDGNLSFLQPKSTVQKLSFSFACSTATQIPLQSSELVVDKVRRLVLEFESLTEPIDRVKRLLHYADRLPPFDESARVPGNRVMGCTTQVWLETRMDEFGRMAFRADSDSEITKGFCSCLIWMLDGAEPAEVVAVKAEDLGAMNVGMHGKTQSRVNTWHNVLISMQKRTKALVSQRMGKPLSEPFPSLVVAGDGGITAHVW